MTSGRCSRTRRPNPPLSCFPPHSMLTALRPARNLITRKAFTHTTTRTPTTTFARNMSNANSDQLAQGGEAAGIQLDPTRRALVQSVLDVSLRV